MKFENRIDKRRMGWTLVILITLSSVIGLLFQDPIPQPQDYHHFADARRIWSIPNFWNVFSNVPFLIAGVFGLIKTAQWQKPAFSIGSSLCSALFFFGLFLVGLGSALYHLWPDDAMLVWDRLAMTVVFMALFSMVLSDFVSVRLGKIVVIPLIILGVSSVLVWFLDQNESPGDLRFYALVQYLPMLLIPIILVCFSASQTKSTPYWALACFYVIAKVFEQFDGQVFRLINISGHTIKHLVAGFGACLFLMLLNKYIDGQDSSEACE